MADLLNIPTNKALVSMSVPISLGMLSTFLFQVIDTYFVGQIGADALAALSFASTVYFMAVGLFIGFSVGVSIIIGTAYGEEDHAKIHKTIWVAIALSSLLTVGLITIIIIYIDPIFRLLGASSDILPYIKEYLVPLSLGLPLLTIGILCGGVLRSTGNVTKPEIVMAIAGIINLVLDYAFIFGKWGFPEYGIKGAAYATVSSWVFIIIGMLILLMQDRLLKLKINSNSSSLEISRDIFKLSAPTIVTQVIGPVTLIYLTYLLAQQSSMAVAAFGVAGRIEMLLMIGILGVSTAITPFIAQNSGAKQVQRIEEAIAFGGKSSSYLGILVAILLFLFIKPIAGLFSDNQDILNYTAYYFYIVSLSYVSYGLYLITTSIFNGLQLPVNSLKITLIKSLAFTIPLTFIGSFWGIEGIFIGLSLSNILAGIYAGYEMRKEFRRVNSPLADVNVFQEYMNDFKRFYKYIFG
ncbi:MAG: MATE family efflux transporter [Chitinophagales bacterium]|nr:MATE family efflux transporter [Chitinophagales bacterium]